MKIAITGKGGVGKTLLASLLSKIFSEHGYAVLAIDADPDANLAANLGYPEPEDITPISEMKDLIEERTGARPGQSVTLYKLNPRVDDIPDKYSVKINGIRLMVMGRVKKAGTGCYCPENALLQALIAHLLLQRNEVVIMDMEAGIEHLTRGTAKVMDRLIIVVEPGRRSIETAQRIIGLAKDLDLKNIAIVGNKIHNPSQKEFIIKNLSASEFLGFIPYDDAVITADLAGCSIINSSQPILSEVNKIYQAIISSHDRLTNK